MRGGLRPSLLEQVANVLVGFNRLIEPFVRLFEIDAILDRERCRAQRRLPVVRLRRRDGRSRVSEHFLRGVRADRERNREILPMDRNGRLIGAELRDLVRQPLREGSALRFGFHAQRVLGGIVIE